MKCSNYIIVICLLILASCTNKHSTEVKKSEGIDNSQKVFLITIDGIRWQELFTGADRSLLMNTDYVSTSRRTLLKQYLRLTPSGRRKLLMPFVWTTVSEIGQIHGNRNKGSKVNLTNTMHFSYPGYNEILTGKSDDDNITSNEKIPNPNVTILEIAEKSDRYKKKGGVVAFASWDVFPYIINEKRSGIYINSGFRKAMSCKSNLTEKEILLNKLQDNISHATSYARFDIFTHQYSLETIKKKHPKLIYISYGNADSYAHDGKYDKYLNNIKSIDDFIKELWTFTQQDEFYKGKTTFIITTDHGRGLEPLENWQHHGNKIKGSDEVWLITFGDKIEAKGEITKQEQLYSNQIANSIAKILGLAISDTAGRPLDFIKY